MLLVFALLAAAAGLACFALAMERHWRQLFEQPLPRRAVLALRSTGAALLAASLGLCLASDHATMAALVWVMLLALSALAVAMFFALQRR